MVDVIEIVLELNASSFINSGKVARGRVIRTIPGGVISCQVDDSIRGATKPAGQFNTVQDAQAAIIAYWDRCNVVLESHNWDSTDR